MPIMKVDEETPTWELGSQLMNAGFMDVPVDGLAAIAAKRAAAWKPKLEDIPGVNELIDTLRPRRAKPQQLHDFIEPPPTPDAPPSPSSLYYPPLTSLEQELAKRGVPLK